MNNSSPVKLLKPTTETYLLNIQNTIKKQGKIIINSRRRCVGSSFSVFFPNIVELLCHILLEWTLLLVLVDSTASTQSWLLYIRSLCGLQLKFRETSPKCCLFSVSDPQVSPSPAPKWRLESTDQCTSR